MQASANEMNAKYNEAINKNKKRSNQKKKIASK